MADKIALTIAQQFEVERMTRVVDAATDIEELRRLCRQLIQAWHCQKAATHWAIEQAMDSDRAARVSAVQPG